MCLEVKRSHVRTPIPTAPCLKMLDYASGGWVTPYQNRRVVFGDGYFEPLYKPAFKNYIDHVFTNAGELVRGSSVYGGVIHAHKDDVGYGEKMPLLPTDHRIRCSGWFKAVAHNVLAVGRNTDLVCERLYIPAFDVRNYTAKELRLLFRMYPLSFGGHTAEVLRLLNRQMKGVTY